MYLIILYLMEFFLIRLNIAKVIPIQKADEKTSVIIDLYLYCHASLKSLNNLMYSSV